MTCACTSRCCLETQRLRDRVAELEAALGMTALSPPLHIAGLSPTCSRVLGMLLTRELVSKESLRIALYGDRLDVDEPEGNVLAVWIAKLRIFLRPKGIEIKTAWGVGHYMEPEQKRKALAALGLDPKRLAA